jgi:putative peptidoglycan lipid II flippase
MLASLLGLAATEINIFVDTLLASFLPEGSVSFLYFGNRLVQFPQGVFAVALGVAIIPTLSRQVTHGQIEKLKETLSFAIQLILFITIPATVGLIVLRESIINLLFEWGGEFDRLSTIGTAHALFYYSIGLCAFSGIKIIVPVFYSLKDSLTPVRIGVYAMILNVFLNVMLMGPLLHGGLALATSLSAFFNVALLVFILRKRIGGLQGRKILKSTVKLLIVSTIMGFVIYSIDNSFYHLESNILLKVGVLFGNIAFGVVLYLVLSFFVINDEVRFLMDLARNKISSNSCQMRK